LADAIAPWVQRLTVYDDPNAFLANIADHKDDLVFANWSGEKSRNRAALIPAICEAAGIEYTGADSYVHIVTHDKMIAKTLCAEFGLTYAPGVLIRSPDDLPYVSLPEPPLVIKPSMEGSSIGVGEDSLVETAAQARERATHQLSVFKQPILIEKFIPGREISVCLAGPQGQRPTVYEGEWQFPGDPDYFHSSLFTTSLKPKLIAPDHLKLLNREIPPKIRSRIERMFMQLGKVDFMRVDGRLTADGTFHVVELSVDIDLSPKGEFAGLPMLTGRTYADIVRSWLEIAIADYRDAN
jgi:D-alanine-D-alanine ligase